MQTKLKLTGVLIVALLGGAILFHRDKNRRDENKDGRSDSAVNFEQSVGVLDFNKFNEKFIDEKIRYGLKRNDVELILGKPYKEDTFMGKETASYVLKGKKFTGLDFSRFTVVYQGGKVISVDKGWGM